jgi:pyruvate/2-oxoacid:ferredoxin oxidoreductase beta subunit
MPIALRQFLRGMGEKVMFISTAGCVMPIIIDGPRSKPITEHEGKSIPWLFVPFGSTAIRAGGVKSGFVARGDTETEVVVWAGDGAAFDIGFGGLSAAAERNEDIIYACHDNEAYMNTGIQRSSATPWGSTTTTNPFPAPKGENKKDTTIILADHGIPYAATATIAYPDDLIRKVRKAKDIKGFRFLHILNPCPTGWQYPSELTVKMSRLAVQTKVFPLFEIEDGTRYTMNMEPDEVPVEEYIRIQGRNKHLTHEEIAKLQEDVDERWDRLQYLAHYKRQGEGAKESTLAWDSGMLE